MATTQPIPASSTHSGQLPSTLDGPAATSAPAPAILSTPTNVPLPKTNARRGVTQMRNPYYYIGGPQRTHSRSLGGDIVTGDIQASLQGRFKSVVPNSLKKVDTTVGSFGLMKVGMNRPEMYDRYTAAQRTSEGTQAAASKASQEGYSSLKRYRVPGYGPVRTKRKRRTRLSADEAANAHLAPHLRHSTEGRPRGLSPLDIKSEQARLLTLLRSLQPLIVVDQLCKALAYFGGIPGAPPPSNDIFPESALTSGSGAFLIGWMGEIFPAVVQPPPAPVAAQPYQVSPVVPPAVAPTAPTASPMPAQQTPQRRGPGRPMGSKGTVPRKDKGIPRNRGQPSPAMVQNHGRAVVVIDDTPSPSPDFRRGPLDNVRPQERLETLPGPAVEQPNPMASTISFPAAGGGAMIRPQIHAIGAEGEFREDSAAQLISSASPDSTMTTSQISPIQEEDVMPLTSESGSQSAHATLPQGSSRKRKAPEPPQDAGSAFIGADNTTPGPQQTEMTSSAEPHSTQSADAKRRRISGKGAKTAGQSAAESYSASAMAASPTVSNGLFGARAVSVSSESAASETSSNGQLARDPTPENWQQARQQQQSQEERWRQDQALIYQQYRQQREQAVEEGPATHQSQSQYLPGSQQTTTQVKQEIEDGRVLQQTMTNNVAHLQQLETGQYPSAMAGIQHMPLEAAAGQPGMNPYPAFGDRDT